MSWVAQAASRWSEAMADFIPKEQMQAYTRWQADSFDAPVKKAAPPAPAPAPSPPPPPPAPAPEPTEIIPPAPPLPTAEELEAIYNEAHTKGQETGYEEGYKTGIAAAQEHVNTLTQLVKNLQNSLEQLDQEIAESLLACSLEVARQMTKAALQANPEILLPTIREALNALPLHHGPVTLLVSPDDAAIVEEHLGDQFNHSGWRIQEDREIAAGGCKLTAGASEVDATLPTRWRRILETIGTSPAWLDAQP